MRVIATAGHVDHGKSTLVRALTGMEPDRWAEERRRGMTIDLGYAWTELAVAGGPPEQLAFVDVPGHQRFVTNMLAGVGPVPAVVLVLAADQGWGRQTSEHLDAISALGIEYGVLAITRVDLASAERLAEVSAEAASRLASSSLARGPAVETVAVSGATGQGLDQLRAALGRLLQRLPAPRTDGRVRLWVDRAFTVRGAGTVVTGTLGAGRIAVGDELELRGQPHVVRGLQQLGQPVEQVTATSRVAVNLRGVQRDLVGRGDCLLTLRAWWLTDQLDVRLQPLLAEPAVEQVLHLGSASIPVRVRMLAEDTARLTLGAPMAAEPGDRGVLRDPGQQSVTAGVLVLDVDPPVLRRRGAARERGLQLASGAASTLAAQVARRGAVPTATLALLGVPITDGAAVLRRGGWLVDPQAWQDFATALRRAVDEHARADPQQPMMADEAARRAVGLPDPELLRMLADEAGLLSAGGRIGRPGSRPSPGAAAGALEQLLNRLAEHPFAAPERDELVALGLGPRELATAAGTGRLLRLAPDLVVASDAAERAVRLLSGIEQPFTASQARQALGTTRRVALPLLEHLDRVGLTRRLDAALRELCGDQPPG